MARTLKIIADSIREILLPSGIRISYDDSREGVALVGDALDPCGYDVYIVSKDDLNRAVSLISEEGESRAAEYVSRRGRYVGRVNFCVFIRWW